MAQNHMAPIGIWRLQLSMMRDLHDCYRRRNMVWSGNDGDRIGETSAVATRRADTSPAQYEPPQVPQSSNPGQNTEYLQGCSKLFFGWFSFPLFFCIYLVSTPNFGTNLDLWCKKKYNTYFWVNWGSIVTHPASTDPETWDKKRPTLHQCCDPFFESQKSWCKVCEGWNNYDMGGSIVMEGIKNLKWVYLLENPI